MQAGHTVFCLVSATTTSDPECTVPAGNADGSCGTANGVHCGTANGVQTATKPTANLCASTAAATTTVTENATNWTWSCTGYGTGSTAPCSAPKPPALDTCTSQTITWTGNGRTCSASSGTGTENDTKSVSDPDTGGTDKAYGTAGIRCDAGNVWTITSSSCACNTATMVCDVAKCLAGNPPPYTCTSNKHGCAVGVAGSVAWQGTEGSCSNIGGFTCTHAASGTSVGCTACSCSSCFIAGTLVTMADGSKKSIEDVNIGDQVLGADGQINNVEEIILHDIKERSLYSFNGGSFFVTAEHPFMTEQGWKAIDPELTINLNADFVAEHGKPNVLMVGDKLVLETGEMMLLETIESRDRYPVKMPVYNLRVDGNSTYYADGYLVHNK
jgi:hypothetical protein